MLPTHVKRGDDSITEHSFTQGCIADIDYQLQHNGRTLIGIHSVYACFERSPSMNALKGIRVCMF